MELKPNITIAVISRNRALSLDRTLSALNELDYPVYEILVVDNESSDNTREIIQKWGAKYLFSPRKNGFSLSRQVAIDNANSSYVLWCDDDCIPDKNWASAFLEKFLSDPQIAILGGHVINVGFPANLLYKGRSIHNSNGSLQFVEDPFSADYYGNLNLALNLASVRKVGGYDPFFKGGYEEIDLAETVKKKGFKVGYVPNAVVTHFHQTTAFKKGRFLYGGSLMRIYFFLKHYKPSNLKEIVLFIIREFYLFCKDLYRYSKLLISALLKFNVNQIKIACIEIINSISSRVLIPFLWFRVKRFNKRMIQSRYLVQ